MRRKLEDIGQLIYANFQQIKLHYDDCFRAIANSVEQRSEFSLEVGQHIEELPGCQEERGLQLPGLGIKHGIFELFSVWGNRVDPESIILTCSLSLGAIVVDSTHIEVHRRTHNRLLPPLGNNEVNTGVQHEFSQCLIVFLLNVWSSVLLVSCRRLDHQFV